VESSVPSVRADDDQLVTAQGVRFSTIRKRESADAGSRGSIVLTVNVYLLMRCNVSQPRSNDGLAKAGLIGIGRTVTAVGTRDPIMTSCRLQLDTVAIACCCCA
jgi:hypothetical protein